MGNVESGEGKFSSRCTQFMNYKELFAQQFVRQITTGKLLDFRD